MTQSNASTNLDNFSLGTNLSGIADWSPQYPFLNFFSNSRNWITHTDKVWDTQEYEQLQLDEFGWLTSLSGAGDNTEYTSVSTFIPNPNNGSRFVVLYDGEGTINYRFGAVKDEAASTTGRDVFEAIPNQFLNLQITATDPNATGDYLRNIRVVPEEYEQSNDSLIFNPDFLSSLDGYSTLRFMEWIETNNSQQSEWSDRPQVGDYNYSDGVPVEVMVELANQTGTDPWFTIPHQATDEYIENFAQIVLENLDPELDVYVEFSNEVWNFDFQQTHWAVAQGRQEFADSSVGNFAKALDWYSQRTTETIQIWEDVFNAEADRVVGILSAQADNPWTGNRVLGLNWATDGSTPQDHGIDAISIAPYFGSYLGSPQNASEVESWTTEADGGLGKLFEELTQGGVLSNGYPGGALQRSADSITAYSELAQQHNVELVAYEGGQHLAGSRGVENNQAITDLFIAANRDARIGDVYQEYLDTWNELGGGLFVHHTDVRTPSKWGSWGARENIYQENAPKYDALMNYNAKEVSEPSSVITTLLLGVVILLKCPLGKKLLGR